ncbi:MAG: hydroxylamine reductase, partial [Deltaproteobacteria bacterium]|nr:hydroxylamine reductase [Deltaproteobacteria bacterium]
MFCFQCEQTAKGEACTKIGVCGKQPDTAALQDLLIYALKGLSLYAVEGHKVGVKDTEVDTFSCEAIFSTLTNVNFDSERFATLVNQTVALREQLKAKVAAAGGNTEISEAAATFQPGATLDAMVAQGEGVGIKSDPDVDPDILSLKELLVYGLKGLAAYADHARILGQTDDTIHTFIYEALAATLNKDVGVDELVGLALKCGEINLK